MLTTQLSQTSLASSVGTWNPALTHTSLAAIDGVVSGTNAAGNNALIEITDAPADYGNSVSVILSAHWHTNGNASRAKNLLLELLQGGVVIASYATPSLTGNVAYQTNSSDPITLSATKGQVDAWQLRVTMQEGGGMADTVSVEIDRAWVSLNYNAAAESFPLSFSGTIPAQSLSATLDHYIEPRPISFSGEVPVQALAATLVFKELTPPDPATLTISGRTLDWAPVPSGVTSQRIERRRVG